MVTLRLCKESDYFKTICSGGFAVLIPVSNARDHVDDVLCKETKDRWVKLPEPERVVDLLLDEMYDTYNSTTGSLFSGFALRTEMEKEQVMNDLLHLFIAADKVLSINQWSLEQD